MNDTDTEESYRVWACDNQVYGPIPLPVLLGWAQDARVLPETWVYLDTKKEWRQAKKVELLHFPPGEATLFLRRQAAEGRSIDPVELRQFAVLAGLSNQ